MTVVKLQTECYMRGERATISRTLTRVSRLSDRSKYDFLREEINNTSISEFFDLIIDLHKYEDGIYILKPCNEYKDFESGHIEDYDLMLVPYKPEKPEDKRMTS